VSAVPDSASNAAALPSFSPHGPSAALAQVTVHRQAAQTAQARKDLRQRARHEPMGRQGPGENGQPNGSDDPEHGATAERMLEWVRRPSNETAYPDMVSVALAGRKDGLSCCC
jgi:hypothetical protein